VRVIFDMIVLAAILYIAVLFIKNTIARILTLYFIDIVVAVLLAINGAAETKLIVFAACGFILNTLMMFMPDSENENSKLKTNYYIFISVIAVLIIAYSVFFIAIKRGYAQVVTTSRPNAAVFLVFCAVFTALYFVMTEKTGDIENE
jgi:hypothetical protein